MINSFDSEVVCLQGFSSDFLTEVSLMPLIYCWFTYSLNHRPPTMLASRLIDYEIHNVSYLVVYMLFYTLYL